MVYPFLIENAHLISYIIHSDNRNPPYPQLSAVLSPSIVLAQRKPTAFGQEEKHILFEQMCLYLSLFFIWIRFSPQIFFNTPRGPYSVHRLPSQIRIVIVVVAPHLCFHTIAIFAYRLVSIRLSSKTKNYNQPTAEMCVISKRTVQSLKCD